MTAEEPAFVDPPQWLPAVRVVCPSCQARSKRSSGTVDIVQVLEDATSVYGTQLTNQARLALGNCLKHGSELPVKPDPDDFWGEFTYAPMPNAITFHCRCGSVDVVPSALLRELRLYIDSRSKVVRIMAIDRTGL